MMKLIFFFLTIACAVFAVEKGAKVKEKAKETAAATGEYIGEKRQAAQAEIKNTLDEINTSVEELNLQLQTATDEKKEKLKARVNQLEEKKVALEQDYEKLKISTGKAWGDLRQGIEQAMQNLKAAVGKAKSQFSE